VIEKARRILRHEEPPLCLRHPCGVLVIVALVPQEHLPEPPDNLPRLGRCEEKLLLDIANSSEAAQVRSRKAVQRDDRSGDQRPILRQMYWNDRLDVRIEIRLITQAVAIVEIELNGTLTRSPTGFCVCSSAKPTSCCNSPNTT
jgi:hypothetical protein